MKAKKKLKSGSERVQMYDVAFESFSDMSYFEKFIPDYAEVVQVVICHEFGDYGEGDQAWFNIDWKEKEQ